MWTKMLCSRLIISLPFRKKKKEKEKEKELVFVRQGHHRSIGYSASTVHGSTLVLADSMGYGVPIWEAKTMVLYLLRTKKLSSPASNYFDKRKLIFNIDLIPGH